MTDLAKRLLAAVTLAWVVGLIVFLVLTYTLDLHSWPFNPR